MITMAQIRRTKQQSGFAAGSSLQLPLTIVLFCILFSLIVYVAIVPEQPVSSSSSSSSSLSSSSSGAAGNGSNAAVGAAAAVAALAMGPVALEFAEAAAAHDYSKVAHMAQNKLRTTVQHKREQLTMALNSLTTSALPIGRLRLLRDKHQIVGERLREIKSGKETVEEVLHGSTVQLQQQVNHDKPPMELEEIVDYLTGWIHMLHDTLGEAKHANFEQIWQAYHDLTVKTLYPWDRDYLSRMPVRRDDESIFLSLAAYRDENCFDTIRWAYEKAKHPEKLYVGLVQQNCHADCQSGIMDGGSTEAVEPDQDCYQAFCDTPQGQEICARKQVRKLDIDEPESLGPYAARYFASKLWYGEQWYMQTDAHMTFAQDWDATSVQMLKAAPSDKPVISHYPPSHLANLEEMATKPSSRLCGPLFATSDLESQIIRLEGASNYDTVHLDIPRFAPFTAAGYFVAHSDFLRDVPFDPFLPWIFMGEEIIMSTRLWTSGYDIFSPTHAVVGHMYVRRHKPKFWESINRAFTYGVHNPLQAMVLDRIKYQLGYPEAAKDMMRSKSLLTAVEQYSMGTQRPLDEYLRIVGLDMVSKEVTVTHWCEKGHPPPGFENLNHLYEGSWKEYPKE